MYADIITHYLHVVLIVHTDVFKFLVKTILIVGDALQPQQYHVIHVISTHHKFNVSKIVNIVVFNFPVEIILIAGDADNNHDNYTYCVIYKRLRKFFIKHHKNFNKI